MKTLLIIALLAFTGNAFCQQPVLSPFQRSQGTGVYEGYTQFQGDIDKDGKTDLIFMGPSWVFIHYTTSDYENTLSKRKEILLHEDPNFDKKIPGAYAGYKFGIEDMDEDGNFDLVFNGATITAYLRGLGKRQFATPANRTVIKKK